MDQEEIKAGLVTHYDARAERRARRSPPPSREALRARFVELLRREGRSHLVDFGAGTGVDAVEFAATGFEVSAIDLSPEHVALCRQQGIDAVVGDFYDLPYADDSFDCGYAMSTLIHVPDCDMGGVLREFRRVLEAGAVLGAGLWGGFEQHGIWDDDPDELKRYFALRTDERACELLAAEFVVEEFETIPIEGEPAHYQWFVLRNR